MSKTKMFKMNKAGTRAFIGMSIDSDGEEWQPVVYGNMKEDSLHPIIVRLPMGDNVIYFVEDSLIGLSTIRLRPDRVFNSMEEAIAKAEELANDPEWQAKHDKDIEEHLENQ